MRRRYLIQGSKSNNIVYYTTIDNNTVNVRMSAFNVTILSNTYNEMGIITCEGNIKFIDRQAFYNCSNLTSIVIPDSVTSIGETAFGGCASLISIAISNNVTSIGDQVFSYCTSLTSIVVDAGNSTYDSRNGCNAIIETASNTLIMGCQNTIIPNSITSIGDYAFEGCSDLISIEIPDSVTSIGRDAFHSCSSLTNIVIPNSVTSIENSAFQGCNGLTSIKIPNSVTSIGRDAFNKCRGLTDVEIGNGVTSIGSSAFYDCMNLSSVYVKAITPPTLDFIVFNSNPSNRKIYVPRASLNDYKTASGWSEYADAIEPYDFDGGSIMFPINLVSGDNGDIGIALHKYILSVAEYDSGGWLYYAFKENQQVYANGYRVLAVATYGTDYQGLILAEIENKPSNLLSAIFFDSGFLVWNLD